ncbi:MAG: hypothetical protein JWO73_489 [Candidatus Taylorbacteria bacterium]|nr:hypothetical protein [Candidatus Taylorbacteria bacterium]
MKKNLKKIEIALKLIFVLSVSMLWAQGWFERVWAFAFLISSLLLGITLIFNKESSYGYKCSELEYSYRRIEGAVLLVFAIVSIVFCFWYLIPNNLI